MLPVFAENSFGDSDSSVEGHLKRVGSYLLRLVLRMTEETKLTSLPDL